MKLGEGYGQANDFIVDLTGSPISVLKAIEDLDFTMTKNNRHFINRVYLKKDENLIGVFERT